MEKHPFKIKKGEDTTLNYNVSVQSGSLILKFINDTYVVFEEEFTSDQQGSFSFTPSSRIQIITVIGNDLNATTRGEAETSLLISRIQIITVIGNFTKGGCDVEIID